MKYSEEILNQVKEYAGYLMKPEQIARLIDMDVFELKSILKNKRDPLTIQYEKGKTETILEIRKQEIQLAKMGSPMAIELVNKFALEQKLAEK